MRFGPQREMPKYKCYKEVWALKIEKIVLFARSDATNSLYVFFKKDDGFEPIHISDPSLFQRFPEPESEDLGYYIVYKDGYKSWSPTKAFEEGYELIN